MPDQIKETAVETIVKSITAVQEAVDKYGSRLDALEKDKIDKAAADATKGIETLNAIEAKMKKQEEDIKSLELALAKGNAEGADALKTIDGEYAKAFGTYLRTGRAMADEMSDGMIETLAKALSVGGVSLTRKDIVEGRNVDGGYWIQPQRANWISERLYETSPMRQVCNVVTTSSNEFEVPMEDGDVPYHWVGEVEETPVTDTPKEGLIKIYVHEITANPRASKRQLQDVGFDLEAWLNRKLQSAFSRGQNSSFVTGDGAKRPKGFLAYPAWTTPGTYENHKIEHLDSGTSGDFDADNLVELQNSLFEDFQNGAVWMMRRDTFTRVMTLKTSTGGDYLLNPRMIMEGAEKILLGAPVHFAADMPAIAADASAIAYGNFMEGYTIVDRLGFNVLRNPYKSTAFTYFESSARVGGAVTNYQAIKVLDLSA